MSTDDLTKPLGGKKPEDYDTNPMLETILTTVKEGFVEMRAEFAKVYGEFAKVNTRLDELENRVSNVEQKIP